jgi:hypothetical protein
VQHATEVLRSHIDVHQYRLWPSCRLVVAVRRGERDELEQAEHRSRNRLAQLFELRERFLYGNRIGARVHEQALDAVRHQRTNVGFGRFGNARFGWARRNCVSSGL